jgi:hypothetical protein
LTNIFLNWYLSPPKRALPQDGESSNKYYERVPETASILSGYTIGPRILRDEDVYELTGPENDEDPFDDERRH